MFSLEIFDFICSIVMPLFVFLNEFSACGELFSHVQELFIRIDQGIFILQFFFL